MGQKLPLKEVLALGFFMFALFLGAGNLIFPPLLGQQAGDSLLPAILGFLVTAVGLPILSIVIISQAGGNLSTLSSRVHPIFAKVFPVVIYLTIGPFFGIPRTGTVAYEIGVGPFLSKVNEVSLFLATLVFFLTTFWLSLNPAKLVDRVGKVLTPILFILILIISLRGVISPLGNIGEASEKYREGAFFSGFLEGFLTMDAIGALVFGIVIIHRIQEKGITSEKIIRSNTIVAGLIAGLGLSFVYITLSYIGATSIPAIGLQENGGVILTTVTSMLYGRFGTILLALVISGACLTTAIGLVSACGEFLSQQFKRVPYPFIIALLCLFSFTMANLGLNQLISFSLPILIMIYPIAIVLIFLSLWHSLTSIPSPVYRGSIIGAGLISVIDGLMTAGFDLVLLSPILDVIPFFQEGVGWIVPSVVGGFFGYLVYLKVEK